MKLSKILKGIAEINDAEDTEISSVEYDSRKVKEGSLFVAVKGYETDGHKYIDSAVKNGAAAILAQEKRECAVPLICVPDTRRALAAAGANFFGRSADRLKIIGVTGTNGKTTVTYLVKQILDLVGIKTGLIGTNKNMIGDKVLETGRTTPESLELQKLFAEMEKEGATHVIMEVSSHALALSRTYGIEFEVGAFTNLTQDHLDYHKTMENYAETKSRFFAYCDNAVINADSDWFDTMTKNVRGKLITYGVEKDADIKAQNVVHTDSGVSYDAVGNGKNIHIDFPIPGGFSVYNSLCVCAVCEAVGIADEKIEESLKTFGTVKGRCELVPIDKPYKVIIDYAHTPDGMENILTAVNEFKKGRIITVFGCGGDRDKGKRPKMGAMGKKYSDITVVTSDNPRSEDMQSIIDDIMTGIPDRTNVYTEPDRKKAIKLAMSLAKKDDIVLLLGKGHETVQKFKDYNIEFDERKIVRELCDLV